MLSTRNGLWLTKASPPNVPSLRTDGMIEAIANGEVRLASSYSNIVLQAGATDILTVSSSNVTVNTNLLVKGTIDSMYSSDLYVKDKTIVIAAVLDSRGCNVHAGAGAGAGAEAGAGDGAGISIGGGDAQSMRWKTDGGGGAWTFRGGGLQIVATSSNAYGGEISYGFSINPASMALEMHALLSNASGTSRRRVAVFGPPSVSDVVPVGFLPSSALPW